MTNTIFGIIVYDEYYIDKIYIWDNCIGQILYRQDSYLG